MITATLVEKARDGHRGLFLLGLGTQVGIPSPYPHSKVIEARGKAPSRDIRFILSLMAVNRAVVRDIEDGSYPNYLAFISYLDDTTNLVTSTDIAFFTPAGFTDPDDYMAAITAAVVANATTHGFTLSAGVIMESWNSTQIKALFPVAPSSYQTIVSQTGTAAPAVAGGLTPTSTYPAGTTFTWARSSAGVYTLTASTAVFNTSKTGVFVAPLQNLNASIRAVVTSTTVITVTTAVQSVAVLGLLGLTTTPTDALLLGTMIYVQTYV